MIIEVPFFKPYIGEEEISKVVEAMRSGWLTTGPFTKQFESNFAEYIGGDVEAVAVNSATAALHLALEAIGISEGDEVICPSMTFTATAEVVRYLGADPIFVDIDPITLNLDIDAVKSAITKRTKAVMPVHFTGLACEIEPLLELAEQYGLDIVDDAAHALPVDTSCGRVGNTGFRATAFSFYATKTMTTGEGGMLVTSDPEIAARARKMRLHGIDRDVFNRYTDKKASWRYDVVAPGYKYNMTDIAAAIGLVQLNRCDSFAVERRTLATRYSKELTGLPLKLPFIPDVDAEHCWHLYVVRLTDSAPVKRDALITLLKDAGIGSSVHFIPLHRLSYWRDRYDLDPGQFPIADATFEASLSLPLYPGMTEAEQTHVIQTLRTVLES